MTAAAVTEAFDVADLVVRLDLGEPTDRAHLVLLLQERRADELEALTAPSPLPEPSATMLRLRAARWEAITVCEAALLALGEPFVIEPEEER